MGIFKSFPGNSDARPGWEACPRPPQMPYNMLLLSGPTGWAWVKAKKSLQGPNVASWSLHRTPTPVVAKAAWTSPSPASFWVSLKMSEKPQKICGQWDQISAFEEGQNREILADFKYFRHNSSPIFPSHLSLNWIYYKIKG